MCFRDIHPGNHHLKLNDQTASVGFYFRHTGELMFLLATFLGVETKVENTTMGFEDTGQGADVEASRSLVSRGYEMLESLVASREASWWAELVDTPFFGSVERLKLFAHILNHNAYHSGQIVLTLRRAVPE